MNYVGHVTAAATVDDDPDVLLGAALPDLVRGVRLDRSGLPAGVAAGLAHHHRADAAFHDDVRFREPMGAVRRRLAGAGVGRGARRAAAHVGVELLIDDALLAEGAEAFAGVWARLADPDPTVAAIVPDDERDRWLAGLARLTTHLDPWSHTGPAAAAQRLEHLLARRPRLALAPGERAEVAAALAEVADEVTEVAPTLVADVARSLGPPLHRRHI